MRKVWTPVIAICAAVAITGCSSSGDDSNDNAMTPAAFQKAADRICARAARDVSAIPARIDQSRADARAWANRRYAIQSAALDRLAAMEPPEDVQATFDTLVRDMRESTDTARTAQLKLVALDSSLAEEINKSNELQPVVARLTNELRLPACAWF